MTPVRASRMPGQTAAMPALSCSARLQHSISRVESIASELGRLAREKEAASLEAFGLMEAANHTLGEMLLERAGSRRRAAAWMASPHATFDGRTGFAMVSAGELEALWDVVLT